MTIPPLSGAGNRIDIDAEPAANDASVRDDLFQHGQRELDRNSEAETLRSARLAVERAS
jgi:hypothetical protein